MEKIQSHKVRDVWRVRYGLLVEINKYESLPTVWFRGKELKIVKGCKGLKELKADTYDQTLETLYPKGTFVLNDRPIKLVDSFNDYTAEIKLSGGSIYRSISDLKDVLADIDSILNMYDRGDADKNV